MNNTFQFYKFNLISNIDLNIDPIVPNNKNKTIHLNAIKENDILRENIYFKNNSKNFIIESPFASYCIDRDTIDVRYNTEENIISTIYNLPASIVSIYHSDLLLHASGLSVDNNVIAFCAPKGGGKTTLISYISKIFNFFSDDTIYLENNTKNIRCYTGSNKLKLTEETLKHHNNGYKIYVNSSKNIQNKAYIKTEDIDLLPSTNLEFYKLQKIFFIKRTMNNELKVKDIHNINEKKSLLLANIVGSKYLPSDWVIKIIKSDIFNNILSKAEFKYLFIGNNLNYLAENITVLSKLITI